MSAARMSNPYRAAITKAISTESRDMADKYVKEAGGLVM